jgi:hypothetical protein
MNKITKLPNGGKLIENYFGDKFWYLNDKLHREDGPAMEHVNGKKAWCLNGVRIPCKTQKEFERLMRLRVFW